MIKDEALKLALEALDCIYSPLHVREIEKVGNAMKAIKEALAQPEQESDDLTAAYLSGVYDGKNKYAPQPEQEPVAWELRAGKADRVLIEITNNPQRAHDWKASLEEVVPLYAAPPQSFTYEQVKAHIQADLLSSSMPQLQTFTGENPFPPQREWVGLTDEEYKIIRYGSDDSGERYISEIESYVDDCAKAIEAKLMEKNT